MPSRHGSALMALFVKLWVTHVLLTVTCTGQHQTVLVLLHAPVYAARHHAAMHRGIVKVTSPATTSHITPSEGLGAVPIHLSSFTFLTPHNS